MCVWMSGEDAEVEWMVITIKANKQDSTNGRVWSGYDVHT